jgi:hypothetical protein
MPLRLPRRLPGVQQPRQLAVAITHAVVLEEWPAQDYATASSCCSGSAEASNLLPWQRGGSDGPLVPGRRVGCGRSTAPSATGSLSSP